MGEKREIEENWKKMAEKDGEENWRGVAGKNKNKAGYTATLVACGWAWAVFEVF